MKYGILIYLIFFCAVQAADLKFESELNEVNVELDADTIVSKFKFINNTDKTLRIRHTDAGCSCVGLDFLNSKSTYAPGESGVLRATFEIGSFQGTVDKKIQIWMANDPDEKPSMEVILRVHIPTAIALEPKTLEWKVDEASETKTMLVKIDYKKPVKITAVSTSNNDFSAVVETVEEGKIYAVKVTPRDTVQQKLSIVRVETDLEIEKHKLQQGFAVIRKSEE